MGPPPPPPAGLWETEDILKAITSFPGPSGLRAAHISEALACVVAGPAGDLEEALERLIHRCASGYLPLAVTPCFATARLIPLGKRGGGVIPIAVGEVFRRLVGKVLIRGAQQEVVGTHFFPLQFGEGVPAATELIARAAGYFLALGVPLVQIDLKDAYNSVSRAHMLQCV